MARNKGVHAKLSRKKDVVDKPKTPVKASPKQEKKAASTKPKGAKAKLYSFYDKYHKVLMVIPIILFVLSLAQIGLQYQSTGDPFAKDVSLSGGITLTLLRADVNIDTLDSHLAGNFGTGSVSVRALRSTTENLGAIIEASTDVDENSLVDSLEAHFGDLTEDEYSVEITGSSLGASFLSQLVRALLMAFAFMAIVVFIYFRSWGPALAVIAAAAFDIVNTVAVLNLMGVKLSGAGIAALLMLIGYSVDTDMLLSSRVLRTKEGSLYDRLFSAMKPTMLMTFTTLTTVTIALFYTQSEVLRQIMLIVFVGLWFDLVNTWLFNTGILTLWLRRGGKA